MYDVGGVQLPVVVQVSLGPFTSVSCLPSEVAGIVASSVDAGIGVVDIAGIEFCTGTAHEACTACEHIPTIHNLCCAPSFACIDGRQAGTAIEHIAHEIHIFRLEILYASDGS